mmetsp:Transcript_7498/g.5694  ORF Transcript_7498/g.5694 Transcript_7498/m.5694 type:complete len:129 (+) Transcript_7498:29-415(+)
MSDNLDLVTKNADALTIPSRNFYERAIFKMFLSIFYASVGLFYLGLCSQAGGRCNNAVYLSKAAKDANSSDAEDIYNNLSAGYGFACFFYFCAFAIAMGAAFHVSPLTNGSVKERITIRTPIDIDRTV